jgi:hypothetical protein
VGDLAAPGEGMTTPTESDERDRVMRSTTAASNWMKHWHRSRCMGHRAAPLGNVEAIAS